MATREFFHHPEHGEYFIFRINGWEIGLRVVLFGWRVFLRETGSLEMWADYCAGRNREAVRLLLAYLVLIAESYGVGELSADKLERQHRRPLENDRDLVVRMTRFVTAFFEDGHRASIPKIPDEAKLEELRNVGLSGILGDVADKWMQIREE